MIVGLGIDIVEVSRLTDKLEKGNGFRELVFSSSEIRYCETAFAKAERYAARFAAKEAFLKAAGKGLTLGYDLRHIEILNDDLDRPHLHLEGVFREYAKEQGWARTHISLSHTSTFATAVVIIEI